MRLRRAAIRTARTFLQAFVGVLIASGTVTASGLADLSLLDQALGAGIVAALAFVQNLGEDMIPDSASSVDTRLYEESGDE